MDQVIACIDGSAIAISVCDAGAWASQRLKAPLTLLHALERTEFEAQANLSGNIGLGSREHLLEKLTELDAQRSRLALEHGKHMLDDAEERASEDGAIGITKLQRHGDLLETLVSLEQNARVFVMGRSGESHPISAHTVGNHIESVVRGLHRPILITVQEFHEPESFMLAYDGSETAQLALAKVAKTPLLQGLPCHLVLVGKQTEENTQMLEQAQRTLQQADIEVTAALIPGEVQPALCDYQKQHNIGLLVMGAYGHSRIRQFFIGSNTTRMISMSDAPLLLLR